MLIKSLQKKSTANEINRISEKIQKADVVVVGVGAGFSAAAGLNYMDADFFRKNYPNFIKKGYKNINEGIANNWYLNESSAESYWGFWANHIHVIYYKQKQLKAYKDLYKLIAAKKHFIITTNADGQFYKGKFDVNKIFAMQGSYGKFQCQKKCHETIYDNEAMIIDMLDSFDERSLNVSTESVPRCPKCGGLLMPNLRIDSLFAEKPHMVNQQAYMDFINDHCNGQVVFLELGVGFNTPIIIRSPFEQMTKMIESAFLIRVNLYHPAIRGVPDEKSLGTTIDAADLMNVLVS